MAEEKKTAEKTAKKPAEKKTEKKQSQPKAKAEKFLEYKGKPLVRSGNNLYYGDMNDSYVVCLNIKDSKDFNDIKLAGNVTVQLLSTDENASPKERIVKKSEKNGLFNALDLGIAWLERYLKKDA